MARLIRGAQIDPSAFPAPATLSVADKVFFPLSTTADGDWTGVALTTDPKPGYCGVAWNGAWVSVGDASKSAPCYFSRDGGATALALTSLLTGDRLYWNGSIAGAELSSNGPFGDRLALFYMV